jgi:hypothetical protein
LRVEERSEPACAGAAERSRARNKGAAVKGSVREIVMFVRDAVGPCERAESCCLGIQPHRRTRPRPRRRNLEPGARPQRPHQPGLRPHPGGDRPNVANGPAPDAHPAAKLPGIRQADHPDVSLPPPLNLPSKRWQDLILRVSSFRPWALRFPHVSAVALLQGPSASVARKRVKGGCRVV